MATTLDSGPRLDAAAPLADHVLGWDHLEWWVGNARAVTAWLASGFGFRVAAYAGPETGVTDRVSYLRNRATSATWLPPAWTPMARWPATYNVTATASAISHGGW